MQDTAKQITEKMDRDLWATPQWMFNWLDSIYHFDIDLAATKENTKCLDFFSDEENSLTQNWFEHGVTGFCNPPYSGVPPWIEKSILEAERGFTTVLPIQTPNGETYYSDVFKHASVIRYITGRIAFVAPFDYVVPGKPADPKRNKKATPDRYIKKGDEISGNTRGTCIVEFSKKSHFAMPTILHYYRDELIAEFGEQ